MQQRLRNTCWRPGMDDAITRVVDACEGCRLVSQPELPEPMQRRKLPEASWLDVAIDFLGPLPSGDYLLVIIDYFSIYKEVEILRRITAQETVERSDKIFVRFGYPKTITLDNGRQFVSREFEEFCDRRGIVLNSTTPYWPQENGLVERQNRSLMKRLKISQALCRDWKKDLNEYMTMYYSTPHLPTTDYRDKDQQLKDHGKVSEDRRQRAKVSNLEIDDKVIMKNVLPGNKLTPTSAPNTMTVMARHGSRITVQNDQTHKQYDRNTSHLKKVATPVGNQDKTRSEQTIPFETSTQQSEDIRESLDRCHEGSMSDHWFQAEASNDEPVSERNRSQRVIRKPRRFEDCVCEVIVLDIKGVDSG
ncbi:uncharacterized protein K02A2.6-like [Toxorhynchites rutilus septentrionalis]|uniref:uncharacterized protein K02A2.6-like n=1 Tax=Toxorhynchites rutilus septentrionalis TaxID=329112 RepID=UPI002478CDDA|nr:uncharacterized protein K02A2.6-like [Toxorhynchites rutilus septentrionalis]